MFLSRHYPRAGLILGVRLMACCCVSLTAAGKQDCASQPISVPPHLPCCRDVVVHACMLHA